MCTNVSAVTAVSIVCASCTFGGRDPDGGGAASGAVLSSLIGDVFPVHFD
jgi:hypothetical protein